MSLTTTSNRKQYTATNGQTIFAYDFRVDLASDLAVYRNGALLVPTTHYTVDGLTKPAGGNVTLATGATAEDDITILRVVPVTQGSNYVPNEGFPSARVAANLDRLTMIAQQHAEELRRAVKLPITAPEDISPGQLVDLRIIDVKLPRTVIQAEAEAGTSAARRSWTPESVKQAIDALAPGALASTLTGYATLVWVGDQDYVTESNLHNALAVVNRIAAAFAVHEAASVNMTVVVDPGGLFVDQVVTEKAAQTTAAITAPSTNPRIDRVLLDLLTGNATVVTGTEAAVPSPPDIPEGKTPLAQISLSTNTTEITNQSIVDERAFPTTAAVDPAQLPQVPQSKGGYTELETRTSGDDHQIRFKTAENTWSAWITYETDEADCFLPGTPVLMADGSWKPVEQIRIGDWTTSPTGPRMVVALDMGRQQPRVEIIVNKDGARLRCTVNHPIMTSDGRFGAIRPKKQANNRLYRPIIDNEGNRELWRRGNHGDMRVLKPGDEILWRDGSAAAIEDVIHLRSELLEVRPLAITPVTGGLVIVSGGIVASGCYDPTTASMVNPEDVRNFFTLGGMSDGRLVGT